MVHFPPMIGKSSAPPRQERHDPLLDIFRFACPITRGPLQSLDANTLHSPDNGNLYRRVDGIWRFLRLHRAAYFAEFIAGYEAIYQAAGYNSDDPAFYRALPYVADGDTTPACAADWQLRARSYDTLLRQVVGPLARRRRRPLRIADLGAGSGWLSYRLAQKGHHVVAVDLRDNPAGGLGAHIHYDAPFIPLQAEFEALPLAPGQLDLIIFNASFHDAADGNAVLVETARLLNPGGRLVIMDSPFFNDPAGGRQMVAAREAQFQRLIGRPAPRSKAAQFLLYEQLGGMELRSGLAWHIHWPVPQWRWLWRRWRARRRGEAEPAQYPLVCGTPV